MTGKIKYYIFNIVFIALIGGGALFIVYRSKINRFTIETKGETFSVKAYQNDSPLTFDACATEGLASNPQWLKCIRLTNSDVAKLSGNEEIRNCFEGEMTDAQINTARESAQKQYMMTSPTAAENPWKGMVYDVKRIFIVDSQQGKFMMFKISSRTNNGKPGILYGVLKKGLRGWVLPRPNSFAAEAYNILNLKLIDRDLDRLKLSGKVKTKPFSAIEE